MLIADNIQEHHVLIQHAYYFIHENTVCYIIIMLFLKLNQLGLVNDVFPRYCPRNVSTIRKEIIEMNYRENDYYYCCGKQTTP